MSDNNTIKLTGILSEGYGIIPKKLMRDCTLNIYEKGILAYMLSFTGNGNECFPSYETISKDLKISKQSISKYIRSLVGKGYLKITKLYDDPMRHNNKYILIFVESQRRELSIVNDVDLPLSARLTSNNNNNINNNNKRGKPFIPPNPQEVNEYIKEIRSKGFTVNFSGEYFCDHYESTGWNIGKNKMKDWRAAVRKWAQRDKSAKKESIYEEF